MDEKELLGKLEITLTRVNSFINLTETFLLDMQMERDRIEIEYKKRIRPEQEGTMKKHKKGRQGWPCPTGRDCPGSHYEGGN